MCETKITDDIRNWMENKACYNEIDHGIIRKNYIPWFGKRGEIESLLNDIEKEYSKICEENSNLRELLSMYVSFGKAIAKNYTVQNDYLNGVDMKLK